MASTTAVRAAAVRPARKAPRPATSARPRLTVLARPRTASSPLPFTILCTLIVAATLAALLYLNIQMSGTSYEITRLQSQSQRLTQEQQALAETNERLGTPQELEKQARELGMVPVSEPAYIPPPTAKALGDTAPTAGSAAVADTPDTSAAVPPAQIYDQPSSYRGMGNEGE